MHKGTLLDGGFHATDSQGKPIRIMAVRVVNSPSRPSGGNAAQLVTGSPILTVSSPHRPNASAAHFLPSRQVVSPPGLYHSPTHWTQTTKRPLESDYDYSDSKKRREKGGKGLRHFSMKVCEKVQRKGTTSYNEVADELVAEFTSPNHVNFSDQQYDQKNIRRRVYDALNVLMAMNIISKERKEIKWIGLPTNSAQECQNLELEKQRRLERVKHKTTQLHELILQQIAFKNLVERNRQQELQIGTPQVNSAIQLPFIVVNTNKKTVIDCSISNDKYEYQFNFDNTFEIHDDIEVLKRMGMGLGLEKGACTPDNLKKISKMLPRALLAYVHDMANVSGEASISKMLMAPTTSYVPLIKTEIDDEEDDEETSRDALSRQSSLSYTNRHTPDDDDDEMEEEEEDSHDMDYDSETSEPLDVLGFS